MTALGKTLTVFVFLLSLAWCWLTVNAFTTRTNWKTQVDTAKANADSAAARAREMEEAFNSLKASSDTSIKKLSDSIEELKKLNATKDTNITSLNKALSDKIAVEKVAEDKTAILESNIKTTSQQLDDVKKRADNIENKYVGAIRSEQDAKNFALQQKLEAESLRFRNEQVEQQLAQLQSQMQDIRRGGNGLGGSAVIPVPSTLRATVTRIDGDLVTVSLGADAGLVTGAVVDVGRLNPTKYLGKIRITGTEPKSAVGVFIPTTGVRAVGDNLPKVGDEVGVFSK